MTRSVFSTVFFAVLAALAAIAVSVRWLPLAAAAGFAVVIAAALAWWISRAIAQNIAGLERSAAGILKPEMEPESPSVLREFAVLAASIQRASEKAVAALKVSTESRENLEALLDSMQDAVVAVDAAGRILLSNHKMQRLMMQGGLLPSIATSARIGHALVQSIRDPDVLRTVEIALEQRTLAQGRATTALPGSIFEVNASPMPGGGAVVVLHDITRIEQVEKTQQDFIANVSHELRTPLTSITGYVETLLDHEHDLTPTAHSFLSTILKNATRMNRLTEDLLVLARVESDAQSLSPQPLRADHLVREAVQGMSGLVQENGAALELGEITPTQVFADHDAIQQVLGNLIENGIKYGKPRNGGSSRVVVSAKLIAEPQPAVEFSVQDFGLGIPSEHLSRIFERFYRVDKARSRESGGTGLGLAIARHIIQMQYGTIWAESDLNAGSTFRFTLPLAMFPVDEPLI